MKKSFILIICIFLAAGKCFSQGNIKGRVIDSLNGQPLGYATVTVFKAADTAIITYRLSTPDGEFKVPGIPLDFPCRVVISYSGYGIYRKDFGLTGAESTLDLGTIKMTNDAKSLDEVLLIAERPPVVVKKDTIEFNASAFKTLPNALVEDLLKKLPGVQVDRDGNIQVNGKPVNRILVDGKVFFGEDPKMATRNLPANVIDKVQVMDDKEEMLRNGDDNLNNVGKVVNITLKKGVKKGWFGKLYAGAGTDNVYEAGGIANIYRDTLQISVLGYLNNLNRPGFSYSELMQAGGMQRNRSNMNGNSTSIWSNGSGGSGLSINGVNFGGTQNGGGVATSKGAGINLNHSPNKKRSFYAQYFRGNVKNDRRTELDTRQFAGDTIIRNNSLINGDIVTNAHNIGIGARLLPDSLTNILINANYMIGLTDEDRLSDIYSLHNQFGQLSTGDIDQNNQGTIRNYRHSVIFTRLSAIKKGRRFTVGHSLDINNRFNDLYTESDVRFLYPVSYDSAYNQLRRERIPRTDAAFSFNYSDPISKTITFRVSGRYEYGQLQNNISTFNRNGGPGYDVPNTLLSSRFKRISNRAIFSPGIEFKWKDFTITPYVRTLLQYVDNQVASLPKSIRQQQTNLLPMLTIMYKQLNVTYNKDIALPGYTNLIPVIDNTNPYFITIGNPNLLSQERHNLSVNYYFNNPKRNLNISLYANGAVINNDVVQQISVDEKGVQTNSLINANGNRNFYLNANISKQYKNNQRFILSWNTGTNFNYNRNRLIYNNANSWQTGFQFNNWVGLNLNWNDKIELNNSYSINHTFTKYTNPRFPKLEITSHWLEEELIVRWPKHIIWETQLNYNYNSSIRGAPKGIARWHAAVNFTMLKDENAVLKISVFDILNQNNSIWVNASRNMITSTQTNVLSQYFMATFTYNVRAAGVKKKVGGRERLFLF